MRKLTRKLIDAHSYHRPDCKFSFAPLDVCFCVAENMAEEIMRLSAENKRLLAVLKESSND